MVKVWYSGFKRRMLYLLIASLTFTLLYYIGSISDISEEDANMIREQFSELARNIDSIGIFLNNFRIAAGMFIPVLGVALGLFAAFMTGTVFKAFTLTNPELANIPSLAILLTPFGIMEIFSYGLAMSQSVILFKAIIDKRINKDLIYSTLIQLGIVAIILFAAAVIEYYMIKSITDADIII
ncbi:MAG: hypothetical protein KatS3mg003_1858 [Candidatus Nitrosocaldaceae archaeon]|nr:MAG: hypothetical protein KatS3mg003_1858 [Candidatus Nitrosocaldaceae archaeon]